MKKTIFNILMPILMIVDICSVFVFLDLFRVFDIYIPTPRYSNLLTPTLVIFMLILPISLLGIIMNAIWMRKNKISKKSAYVSIVCNWLCIIAFFTTIYVFMISVG
jgi:hypothetical protein